MKRLAIPAALMAAFLSTGCSETYTACKWVGSEFQCREKKRATRSEIDYSMYVLDWTNCVERGEGTRAQCQAKYK